MIEWMKKSTHYVHYVHNLYIWLRHYVYIVPILSLAFYLEYLIDFS